jgi:CheY-like chemotaxis protein
MLVTRGYAVVCALNGLEALDRLATGGPFGVVFMDCHMPELDGYRATERFRAREAAGRRLPIVAMTANAMKGDRERCLQAGMDDYLTKPLRPAELDAILDRWLGTIAEPEPGPAPEPAAVAAAVAVAVEKLLDDARVQSLRHDFGEVAEQLVELFEQGTPPLILELRSAGTEADDEALRRAAHQLKGSCQSIGAAYMAEVAEGIEHGSDAAADVDRLVATFKPTVAAIRSALSGAGDVR